MNPLSLARGGPWVACFLALAATASALDLSGTYADKGTQVGSNAEDAPREASFHALFALETDAGLGAARFGESSTIQLLDDGSSLEVNVRNEQGQRVWHARWGRHQAGYSRDGNRCALRFRSPDSPDDTFLLILEPLEQGRLLQVYLARTHPTSFGLSTQLLGTYLFHRQ